MFKKRLYSLNSVNKIKPYKPVNKILHIIVEITVVLLWRLNNNEKLGKYLITFKEKKGKKETGFSKNIKRDFILFNM